jgi:hypothetical protein
MKFLARDYDKYPIFMGSMWAYVASWKRKIRGGFEGLIWHSIKF